MITPTVNSALPRIGSMTSFRVVFDSLSVNCFRILVNIALDAVDGEKDDVVLMEVEVSVMLGVSLLHRFSLLQ